MKRRERRVCVHECKCVDMSVAVSWTWSLCLSVSLCTLGAAVALLELYLDKVSSLSITLSLTFSHIT